jgi:hypothetical protein
MKYAIKVLPDEAWHIAGEHKTRHRHAGARRSGPHDSPYFVTLCSRGRCFVDALRECGYDERNPEIV